MNMSIWRKRRNTMIFLSFIMVMVILIIPSLPKVSAYNFYYGGEVSPNGNETNPSIILYFENGSSNKYFSNSYLGDLETHNLTLGWYASTGLWLGLPQTLLQISYKASWLSNETVFYKWAGIDRHDFEYMQHNNNVSYAGKLVLSDIPEGQQHIIFTVVEAGIYVNWGNYTQFSFTKAGTARLDFNVKAQAPIASASPSPTPSTTPQVNSDYLLGQILGIVIAVIISTVLVISLLLYRRHRKTIKSTQVKKP
jgi:hypothetical protein